METSEFKASQLKVWVAWEPLNCDWHWDQDSLVGAVPLTCGRCTKSGWLSLQVN